jgi:hypothetical protein
MLPHMTQLSAFSSFFLSLTTKYFFSIPYITLTITLTECNELQSFTDADFCNIDKPMLVTDHQFNYPSIHPPILSQNSP